jgi:hypothetical protein
MDRSRTFGVRLAKLGIASVRTPVRAPRANAIGERVVRSIRRSVWTTRSSSTSDTCMLCTPSTSTTTTLIAHTYWGYRPARQPEIRLVPT